MEQTMSRPTVSVPFLSFQTPSNSVPLLSFQTLSKNLLSRDGGWGGSPTMSPRTGVETGCVPLRGHLEKGSVTN